MLVVWYLAGLLVFGCGWRKGLNERRCAVGTVAAVATVNAASWRWLNGDSTGCRR